MRFEGGKVTPDPLRHACFQAQSICVKFSLMGVMPSETLQMIFNGLHLGRSSQQVLNLPTFRNELP
jgi:phage terminase large subunit-like protein